MNNIINFQSRPVSILWSPKKNVNAAWRVGATPTVIDASERFRTRADRERDKSRDPVERGDYWHAFCKRMALKYHGVEFKYEFREGFDWDKLTGKEKDEYLRIYMDMASARYDALSR